MALLVGGLGGCSGYQDPSIQPAGAAMVEKTDEALTLRLAVDLDNPNNEPLKLLEFEYDVQVNGVRVHKGVRAAETTLAANGHKQVQIPAVVRYDTMQWTREGVPASAKYAVRGELRYITPGEIAQVFFDTGVRKPSASFAWTGEVPLH
jgi:LEA14-like dessication related protein